MERGHHVICCLCADEEEEDGEPSAAVQVVPLDRVQRMCLRLLVNVKYQIETRENLIKAFKIMDRENKGYLSAEEFRTMMQTIGKAVVV